jgi:hypothetical protein
MNLHEPPGVPELFSGAVPKQMLFGHFMCGRQRHAALRDEELMGVLRVRRRDRSPLGGVALTNEISLPGVEGARPS